MARNRTRQVWTVVYPDRNDLAGMGVAHFDDGDDAHAFGTAYRAHRILEETVPARIVDRWTFTQWVRS